MRRSRHQILKLFLAATIAFEPLWGLQVAITKKAKISQELSRFPASDESSSPSQGSRSVLMAENPNPLATGTGTQQLPLFVEAILPGQFESNGTPKKILLPYNVESSTSGSEVEKKNADVIPSRLATGPMKDQVRQGVFGEAPAEGIPSSKTLQYAKRFGRFMTVSLPAETAGFYLALGIYNIRLLAANYAHNPAILHQYIEMLKEPISYVAFSSFVLTNRAVGKLLALAIKEIERHKKPVVRRALLASAKNISRDLTAKGNPAGLRFSHQAASSMYHDAKSTRQKASFLRETSKIPGVGLQVGGMDLAEKLIRFISGPLGMTGGMMASTLVEEFAHDVGVNGDLRKCSPLDSLVEEHWDGLSEKEIQANIRAKLMDLERLKACDRVFWEWTVKQKWQKHRSHVYGMLVASTMSHQIIRKIIQSKAFQSLDPANKAGRTHRMNVLHRATRKAGGTIKPIIFKGLQLTLRAGFLIPGMAPIMFILNLLLFFEINGQLDKYIIRPFYKLPDIRERLRSKIQNIFGDFSYIVKNNWQEPSKSTLPECNPYDDPLMLHHDFSLPDICHGFVNQFKDLTHLLGQYRQTLLDPAHMSHQGWMDYVNGFTSMYASAENFYKLFSLELTREQEYKQQMKFINDEMTKHEYVKKQAGQYAQVSFPRYPKELIDWATGQIAEYNQLISERNEEVKKRNAKVEAGEIEGEPVELEKPFEKSPEQFIDDQRSAPFASQFDLPGSMYGVGFHNIGINIGDFSEDELNVLRRAKLLAARDRIAEIIFEMPIIKNNPDRLKRWIDFQMDLDLDSQGTKDALDYLRSTTADTKALPFTRWGVHGAGRAEDIQRYQLSLLLELREYFLAANDNIPVEKIVVADNPAFDPEVLKKHGQEPIRWFLIERGLKRLTEILWEERSVFYSQMRDWSNLSLEEEMKKSHKNNPFMEIAVFLGKPEKLPLNGGLFLRKFDENPFLADPDAQKNHPDSVGMLRTPYLSDYLISQMACGPNLQEDMAGKNFRWLDFITSFKWGFNVKFIPPGVVTTRPPFCEQGARLPRNFLEIRKKCDVPGNCSSTRQYYNAHEAIWDIDGQEYRGIVDYVRRNVDPDIVGTVTLEDPKTGEVSRGSRFDIWWAQNVSTVLLKQFEEFQSDYFEFMEDEFWKPYFDGGYDILPRSKITPCNITTTGRRGKFKTIKECRAARQKEIEALPDDNKIAKGTQKSMLQEARIMGELLRQSTLKRMADLKKKPQEIDEVDRIFKKYLGLFISELEQISNTIGETDQEVEFFFERQKMVKVYFGSLVNIYSEGQTNEAILVQDKYSDERISDVVLPKLHQDAKELNEHVAALAMYRLYELINEGYTYHGMINAFRDGIKQLKNEKNEKEE